MYYPYSMQVTHFLKRKNCKVSLHFVKYVKSKETGKPRRSFFLCGDKEESLQTSCAISKQPGGLLQRAARGSGVNRAKRVMDGCVLSLALKRLRRLLTIRLRSEEDEGKCRFIYKKIPGRTGDDYEIYSLSFISCCSSSSQVGMVPSTFSG